MPVVFSSKKVRRLDNDLKELLERSNRSRLVGQTSHLISSHGGSCTAFHISCVVEWLRLGRVVGKLPVFEAGCGVGQMALTILSRFPAAQYTGVDNNKLRVDVTVERLSTSGFQREGVNVHVRDWVETWDDPRLWGFLGSRPHFVYYNNINMSGDVDEAFQMLILRHSVEGTVILAYAPLFTGDRARYVSCVVDEIEVDELHFSWLNTTKIQKTYIYTIMQSEA